MNINPSSLNLDFNKEFRELYSLFRSLEENSLKFNAERKLNPLAPLSSGHKANADAILKFAQIFIAFSDKYKAHADDVNFTTETISILDPVKLTEVTMNELYSSMKQVLQIQEMVEHLTKSPQ